MKTLSWLLLVFSLLLLSACSSNPGAAQGSSTAPVAVTTASANSPATGTPQSTATSAPARSSPTAPKATVKPTLAPAGTASAPIQKMLGDQPVQINAQEMMTVATANFNLTGQAPPGSVVSVNNDFIVIGGNRAFSFPINLEEGPNLVEVVASDAQGQQVSVEIVVVYDPTP